MPTAALLRGGVTEAGDSDGSVGDGSRSDAYVPVAVAGGRAFTAVSVGSTPSSGDDSANLVHACAVTTDGRAFCWGKAWVSNGATATFTSPVQVPDR